MADKASLRAQIESLKGQVGALRDRNAALELAHDVAGDLAEKALIMERVVFSNRGGLPGKHARDVAAVALRDARKSYKAVLDSIER